MLPADSPLLFWDPTSARVSKKHNTGTERAGHQRGHQQGRADAVPRVMQTRKRGLSAPPRLGLCLCLLLKEKVGTWHLPANEHPRPGDLPPVTWRWVSETEGWQASLSITNSRSLPKLMSIESVMPSNHLTLCHPLLLLPSIFPSIRVFSNAQEVRQANLLQR